jgi:hypothetical protein
MQRRKRPIARQRGEPTLTRMGRCACGRPLDAGWTATCPQRHTRCLICETDRLMRGVPWSRRKEAQ